MTIIPHYHQILHQPNSRKWYTKAWGMTVIILLFFFLAIMVASGMYVFTVYRGLKAGTVTLDEIFPPAEGSGDTISGYNRPFVGNPLAPVVFVEFVDFECEFCKQASDAINVLLLDPYYKDKARFIMRHFPITAVHKNALRAAVAAECAHEQGKFFEMHNAIFASQNDLSDASLKKLSVQLGLESIAFNDCFENQKPLSVIEKDMQDGIDAGVKSTPSFLVGDRIIEGAPTVDELKLAIDRLLP